MSAAENSCRYCIEPAAPTGAAATKVVIKYVIVRLAIAEAIQPWSAESLLQRWELQHV